MSQNTKESVLIPKRRKAKRMGVRETPQIRIPAHLKWVRGHECAVAGIHGHECAGDMEAAHVRTGTDGGTGIKPSDKYTIPLCWRAHAEQHMVGEQRFEAKYGIDMRAIADAIWQRSPARRRYERNGA